VRIFSDENVSFARALALFISEQGERSGIDKEDRLLLALELAAHDRYAEVGIVQCAGEMQAIQVELLLEVAQLGASIALDERLGENRHG
jgi:hypothetical protein